MGTGHTGFFSDYTMADYRDSALSYGQRAFCFLYESDPSSIAYNVPFVIRIHSALEVAALKSVLKQLIAHHPAFRTIFPVNNEQRVQRIYAEGELSLEVVDAFGFAAQTVDNMVNEFYKRPFDLGRGPLFRGYFLRIAQDEAILLLTAHHIICDGWSLGTLTEDIQQLFIAELRGEKAVLLPLEADYTDFVQRQQDILVGGGKGEELWRYWQEKLSGELTVLNLPLSFPRPPAQTFNGKTHPLNLSDQLIGQLRALGKAERASLYVVLLSGFYALLHRYSGQYDIIVGSPFSGRTLARFNRVIGDFINPVVLRADLQGNPSFKTLLGKVRQLVLEALTHQEYPFPLLVEKLQIERDASRSPIFEVMFNYIQIPGKGGELMFSTPEKKRFQWGGMEIEPYGIANQEGQLSLTFETMEAGASLYSVLKYNTDLLSTECIALMGGHLQNLLEAVIANPELKLSEIPLLSVAEQKQLSKCNATRAAYPQETSIQQLFEQQAIKHPDHIALVYQSKSLTYRELNQRANQLAHHLLKCGVRPQEMLGLYVEPCLDMIVGILAILKAGGTYVPIDPGYPKERVQYLLKDSGCRLVLTSDSLQQELQDIGIAERVLFSAGSDEPNANPRLKTAPDSTAYLIYTSGSTGKPKGCMVTHRNIVRLLNNDRNFFDFSPADVWILAHSYCFDFSVWEMYGALLYGGTLVIADRDDVRDVACFLGLLKKHQVTVLNQTPGAFYNLIGEERQQPEPTLSQHLRYVIFGGERLEPARLIPWAERYDLQATSLINMYGITETTVHVSFYRLSEQDLFAGQGSSPIGVPLPETTIHVCDAYMNALPVGVIGEMYVGGSGVCKGYLNRLELTAERFIPDPFQAGGTLYKTGDLAKRRSDGTLEYIGRNDDQVKIRGHRIEIKEIEHRLLSHDSLKEVVVLAHGEQLVAFVVAKQALNSKALKSYLGNFLPDYMIPAIFVSVAQMPLTANRKIDKKTLLKLAKQGDLLVGTGASKCSPRNPLEAKLLDIWVKVLGTSAQFGITENYFDLGGDSLNAGQLIGRLTREFQTKFSLRDIFQYPTIEQLAEVLQTRLNPLQPSDEQQSKPNETIRETQLEPEPSKINRGVAEKMACNALANFHSVDIPPVAAKTYYPLSHAQKRLWILEQMEENSTIYTVPFNSLLEGELNIPAFQRAFQTLVERHESLRTVFITKDGEPRQKILPHLVLSIPVIDLRAAEHQEAVLRQAIEAEAQSAFVLAEGPLLRLKILILDSAKHLLLFNIHHIISDGVSLGISFKEIFALYSAYLKGRDNPLPPLAIQYKDYVAWQDNYLADESVQEHKAYWHRKLSGELPVLNFPTDFPRPSIQSYRGDVLNFQFDGQLSESLISFSRQQRSTLFMTLLALSKTLLYKYTGQQDIIIGSPVAGREHPDLQGQIGLYVNTLVLRDIVEGENSFLKILEQVRETVTDAQDHQSYPFDRLVDELRVARDLSRSPLFDVMVALQKKQNFELQLEGINTSLYPTRYTISKFDLTFEFLESEHEPLAILIEYNTDLLLETSIQRLWQHFQQLAKNALENPSSKLRDLSLLSDREQEQLIRQAVGPKQPYQREKTLVQLFEEQAQKTPAATAVVSASGQLSYAELNRQANQLASHLKNFHNIFPDQLIALMLDRSERILLGILGILKTGAAYFPIDPSYPDDRMRYLLSDTGCQLLVTESQHIDSLQKYGLKIVDLSTESHYQPRQTLPGKIIDFTVKINTDNPAPAARPENLAYVIYTSGSTGKPKGVMVEHKAVVNLVCALKKQVYSRYDSIVREVFSANYVFDVSVQQIFCTLLLGNTLVMPSNEVLTDARLLLDYLEQNPVDIIDLTPGQFSSLLDAGMAESKKLKVRQITLGSEALPPSLVQRFYQYEHQRQIHLINMYGPTECCVDASCYEIQPSSLEQQGSVPIGKALANMEVYILNGDDQIQSAGLEGEICIAGDGLARGYLNQVKLSLEKFMPHPFQKGQRIYKTGDRGRYLADGNIEFLGRRDDQVKVRGYRVELGDIEYALLRHPLVKLAVAATRNINGINQLIAYVASDGQLQSETLKQHLKELLPDYMVPAAILVLEHIPLNAVGKIDKMSLPTPESVNAGQHKQAPGSELEAKLLGIWEECLGHRNIGIEDSFFDIGGHSLNAVQMLLKVYKQFGVEIPLMAFFQASSICDLAAGIEDIQSYTQHYENTPLLLLNRDFEKKIFCLPPIFGYGVAYQALLGEIEGYAMYGIDLLNRQNLVLDCVETISRLQPQGPYRLLGYSAGGNLAFEVARELARHGERVSELIMIDAIRLKSTHPLTAVELDKQAAMEFENYASLMGIDENLRVFANSSVFKNKMLERIRQYLKYLSQTVNVGQLQSNIHVLKSTNGFSNYGWEALTTGQIHYHDANGQHAQMLFGGFALENAKIIQKIVNQF